MSARSSTPPGSGPFEGYYKNEEAMAATTRRGWYWSGDLGYIDADGWVYFAGRTADWLRVDGENFPAGPIDAVVTRHPDVFLGAVYGVPDVFAGDQVMVALVPREGDRASTSTGSRRWLDEQPDLSPKWHPRYVRITARAPADPFEQGAHPGPPAREVPLRPHRRRPYLRPEHGARAAYHLMTADEESELRAAFDNEGRLRAWDL